MTSKQNLINVLFGILVVLIAGLYLIVSELLTTG